MFLLDIENSLIKKVVTTKSNDKTTYKTDEFKYRITN